MTDVMVCGLSVTTREALSAPRWVYGDAHYWSLQRGCPFCGSMHTGKHVPCEPVACMLCGTVQCKGLNSECRVCLMGWLPGWSRMHQGGTGCGYAGCASKAVAAVRKKRACAEHAGRAKVNGKPMAEYLAECIALRDSGKGWQRWIFTGPRVPW